MLSVTEYLMQPGGVLVLLYIGFQADFFRKPSTMPRYFFVIPRRKRKSESVLQLSYQQLQLLIALRKSVAEMLRKVEKILNNFI